MKALITTVPFGDKDRLPLDLLEKNGVEYLINPLGRKLVESELAEMVSDFDIIIAGTELITDYVMERGKKLKIISRVGIGLDSVDLLAAERRGIKVSYTPDAPAPAVAELTIGLMLSLIRSVQIANLKIHEGVWHRYFGTRLSESTIGIIGMGRIGSSVLRHLSGFNCKRILINDIEEKILIHNEANVSLASKEEIFKEADVISLHVPLTSQTKNMINKKHLEMMKPNTVIINTARGGIINEADLYDVMSAGHLSGAAIDVFEEEPYSGRLNELPNCLLTAHMGSMSIDCRTRMEIEATEEAIRFVTGEVLLGIVPESEYAVQREGL